ncbi:PAS domain-containing methyl-accepting chemotaxis protein [Aliarcobacter skirrowii]|uniref:methyl-accepting chemotaxis protein n=1 Tax=Aliarcobacter skirrowii TaxID=28200 RepID=UPI0029B87816|nr:PAS domain-containing methyl-accepting chemotaxis protein [Aliarcobacter skirrowii]MDX4012310.1 PAS domain-containing methyl-accepting chemotaxis protein [Aliarcobacter skirrowii]
MFLTNKFDRFQLDAIDEAFAVVHFKLNGTILKANKNFLNIMGYSLEEIRGENHKIFCEDSFVNSAEYKQAWDAVNRGVSISADVKRVKRDGKFVFFKATYMPIKNSQKSVVEVVLLAQDITKNRLNDLYFRGQVDAINKSQAVIEFDMQGNILNANKNFLDTIGYTKDEIVGKHHSIFCEESYKNSNEYKEFWKKLNSGEFDSAEYLRIGKNEKEVWIQATYNPIFDLDGKPFKVVKYATDISLKKFAMFEVGKKIEDLTKSLQDLQNASTTMVKEADVSMKGSQEVSVSIEELDAAVLELSNKIENMLSSITNISNTTSESEKIVLEAKEQSKESSNAMLKLNEESIKIGDTIEVISQIAFQTNILSLNAAVEAATAGEAGKGFAVVAQEVRNLATRSNEAAKNINEAIGLIQNLVKNSLDSIHKIDDKIENISNISSTISSSVREQQVISNELASNASQTSQTLNQISQNMVRVSSSTSNTDKEAKTTQKSSNELIEISNELIEKLKVLN